MDGYEIGVDPKLDVGVSVGSLDNGCFVAFDGAHDVGQGLSGNDRFILHFDYDDALWMIESLAKELPEVLKDEVISRIDVL